MKIGGHVSIAGGIFNAPDNAAAIGAECFQMFTRSPQGGPAPKLMPEIVADFLARCKKNKIAEWVVHAPYYINLASEKEALRKGSIRILREELERDSLIGAKYMMFHPGSAKNVGAEAGMKFVIDGCKKILDGYDGSTQLLIEISAGAGEIIGDTFEEIAEILDAVDSEKSFKNKIGVCFDTQHAFGSGYDLRDEDAVKETFAKFDKLIGLERLKMSHCNDSKIELGGHKDRHEHIGEGLIGTKGFKAIIAHPKLQHMNLYCETEHDKIADDIKKLMKIRG
ncbi:MAG: deoxyribonuclease IV [Candidatus Magasanikbacteria bacterium]|nr:deoxyribonuclease IV [Candidatus Magasanikbacteria bacterium]